MTIFELWDQWCEIVEEHNRRIKSEAWYPYYIFIPFLYGLAIAIMGNMVLRSYRINDMELLLFIFLFSSTFVGLLMWINWIFSE